MYPSIECNPHLNISIYPVSEQEARKRRALPDGASLYRLPAHVGGQVPVDAQGFEQTDDWRLPGQPAEGLQPGSSRVSTVGIN